MAEISKVPTFKSSGCTFLQTDRYDEQASRWPTAGVRLQWDPDHSPSGAKLERRAIQLGLRGEALAKFAREWIIQICDISDFVALQRSNIGTHNRDLFTPREEVYHPLDPSVASRLELS